MNKGSNLVPFSSESRERDPQKRARDRSGSDTGHLIDKSSALSLAEYLGSAPNGRRELIEPFLDPAKERPSTNDRNGEHTILSTCSANAPVAVNIADNEGQAISTVQPLRRAEGESLSGRDGVVFGEIPMPLMCSPGAYFESSRIRPSLHQKRPSKSYSVGEPAYMMPIAHLQSELCSMAHGDKTSIGCKQSGPIGHGGRGGRKVRCIVMVSLEGGRCERITIGLKAHGLRLLEDSNTSSTREIIHQDLCTSSAEVGTQATPFLIGPSRPFLHKQGIPYLGVF